MRKPAAVLAAAVLLASIIAVPPAVAQDAGDAPTSCDATSTVTDAVRALLAPLHPVVDLADPVLCDLGAALGQLHDLAEAQLAPAGAPSPGPATPGVAGAPATSASASGPTGFGGVLSTAEASSPDATAIPDVPVGGVLDLGPLALPIFDAAPATSAEDLAAGAAVVDLVRPAMAAAAAIPQEPDGTRATAAVMAISVLLLAAGLLLDQVRKARIPIRR